MQDYVEERHGGYYLAGTRIGLDNIVGLFQDGASPESILRSFPQIGSLEKIYGAITFYLANKDVVDSYLQEQERLTDEARTAQSPLPDGLAAKLRQAREMVTSATL